MKTRIYQWFVALTHGSSDQNKWLYEFTEFDETKLHRDVECFDECGLPVTRNLYEVTREELGSIKASEEALKMSIHVFVKEGEGKIRAFNPRATARKKSAPVVSGRHLFSSRLEQGVH